MLTKYTDTPDLYLKVRGEVGTLYRHSGPLSLSLYIYIYIYIYICQRRGQNTLYRHSGRLSKYQRLGAPQCTETQDLYLNLRGDVGPHFTATQDLYLKEETQCTETQDLYLKIRELEPQYRDTQDFYLKLSGEV